MIWYHNHEKFKCFIEVHKEIHKEIPYEIYGQIIAIELEYPGNSIGIMKVVYKKYGRVATEEDIKKMNKLMVFK